jgi:hypothetical protein
MGAAGGGRRAARYLLLLCRLPPVFPKSSRALSQNFYDWAVPATLPNCELSGGDAGMRTLAHHLNDAWVAIHTV